MRYLFAFFALFLAGCSSPWRNEVKTEIREIERYDPKTGRPMKTATLVESRPVAVEYVAPDGKGGKKLIKVMEKRTGWELSPPPLPKEEEKKAETVPVQ